MASIPETQTPAAPPAETVEERFQQLAAVWHKETDYFSSMEESSAHPAYQQIVGLGPEVVPLLLRDLEQNHTHWFDALQAITGVDPIPASAGGNIPQMVEAWLHWAKDHGYRW